MQSKLLYELVENNLFDKIPDKILITTLGELIWFKDGNNTRSGVVVGINTKGCNVCYRHLTKGKILTKFIKWFDILEMKTEVKELEIKKDSEEE